MFQQLTALLGFAWMQLDSPNIQDKNDQKLHGQDVPDFNDIVLSQN